ncbi:MAG: hypothetical protein IJM64_07010 [Ottowia sp.]|nr:hypothetical protein [Ottowia sp.]
MSSILLAGMTDQEAAALEILIGMHWRDWKVVTLKRSLSLSIPDQNPAARAAEVCVVDLFGFGMRRHSPEHEQQLLDFLGGRSAILLVWGTGGGWYEAEPNTAPGQQLECIKVPYTSVAIRSALNGILTGEKKTGRAPAARKPAADDDAPPARKPAVEDEAPPAARSMRRFAVEDVADAAPVPEKQPAAAAASGVSGAEALQALGAAYPQLASLPLAKLAGKITQAGTAFLVHSGGSPLILSNAERGTAGSPSTEAALFKSLQSPEVQATLRLVPIALDQFDESQRKYIRSPLRQQKPLDVFAWELVGVALHDVELVRRADISLRLTRMPNFTLMGGGDAMDVQLAAICIRTPQSASFLAKSFPRHEERVNRFIALAVLSGLAEVTQAPPVQPRKVVLAAPQTQAQPRVAPKGFFRALLSKLF